jgi:hypothetical protein
MSASQFATTLTPDPPIVQNARFRFDPVDRRYIDDQARTAQSMLQVCVVGGATCTYIPVDAGGPADLAVGDVVCLSSSTDIPRAAKALTSPIANAGTVYGIVMQPAARGALALVAMRGAIASRVTGLSASSPGAVYLDPATGRCTKTITAYAVGFVDNGGMLTLTGAGSGSGGGSGLPGVTVTGSPAAGLALTGTSPTTATWIASTANGPQPINVKTQYLATGGGTLNDRPQLVSADAAAAASSGNKTLFYAAGTYLVTSDLTFSTDVGHWFEQGAMIDAPGHTITISGPIFAHELQQIFTPATKVRFAQYYRQVARVSPFFWGARGDLTGTFDDGPALQQWIDAVSGRSFAGGAEAIFPPAVFQTRTQLNMFGNSGSALKVTGSVGSYAGRGSTIRHIGTRISSSTNPAGTVVVFTTQDAHGMSTLDRVKIKGHTGNSAIPSIGISGQVTVIDATHFSIDGLLGNGGTTGGASGTAGGAVLQMKGVNNTTITGVTFDGMGLCNQGLTYRTDQLSGGAGANGLYLHGCVFQGACGELSNLLAIGDYSSNTGGNTYQAAEVNCYECVFTGTADPTNIETMTDAAWRMLQGGNVKDNAVYDSNFFGCNILCDDSQASGTQVFSNIETGGAYRYTFLAGGSQIKIDTCATENANGTYAGGAFLATFGTGGADAGSVSITNSTIVSPAWDQTIPITSVSNANGVNRVVTCGQLPRFANVSDIVAIDGNSDAAVNGVHTVTAVNMRLNQFTINVTGTGGAAGTGGQYLNQTADGLFINYQDHLTLEKNYLDASDVALKKLGPPIISCGILVPSYPSAGSVDSASNVYRFGHIMLEGDVPIVSSTNTTPITVTTSAAHKRIVGDTICIRAHRVNTNANGLWTVASVPSSTTLTLTSSVGNGVGGATGSVIPTAYDSIPVKDSGGICTGKGIYAAQPLAVYSRGDSAGDQSTNTNRPLAPHNGWAARNPAFSALLAYLPPGVRVIASGEPCEGRLLVELDYKFFKLYTPYGATTALSRAAIGRLKQNSVIKNVAVQVITPFSPTASLMIGTSDTTYGDNLLNGNITGQYGGVVVGAAAGTVYPSAETDNGPDLLRGALIQGGCWRARGQNNIDLVATLVATDVTALTAGVVRVYVDFNNFVVDYY